VTDTSQRNVRLPGTIRSSPLVSRAPIYCGWVILAAGAVGQIMTSPRQTYSVAIFTDHFTRDLEVSRSLVCTLHSIGTVVGCLALPFVGRQVDRHGLRVMVGIITALFALACVYMGFVQNAVMLGIGFVLIRSWDKTAWEWLVPTSSTRNGDRGAGQSCAMPEWCPRCSGVWPSGHRCTP
jgi:MFS family permease